MLIMIINSLTIIILNPFKCSPRVRVPCSFMILVTEFIKIIMLVGVDNRDRENSRIENLTIVQNNKGDVKLLIKLTPGSKDEKISNIIKT